MLARNVKGNCPVSSRVGMETCQVESTSSTFERRRRSSTNDPVTSAVFVSSNLYFCAQATMGLQKSWSTRMIIVVIATIA